MRAAWRRVTSRACRYFWNTLAGDAFYVALLFGGMALAEKRFPSLREPLAAEAGQKLALPLIVARAVLLQFVGNFGDAGIRAGFILIAARRAADANRANGVRPHFDRNAALPS